MRLINLQTGFYEEVEPERVQEAVQSGAYTFDAEDEVTLRTPDDKLGKTDGQTALELLSSGTSGYFFQDEDQFKQEQEERKFNTFTEEAKTIGEGLARGATVGLSDLVGDPEAKKSRKEINPVLSTVSEIVGAIAPLPTKVLAPLKIIGAPTRAVDKIGRTAQAATTKALRGVSAPAARTTGLAARGAAEGALFGVGQTVSEDALGDADFNGESLVSNISKGAFFGAGAGAVFGMGSEVARKRALEAKKDAANELRKAFGVNQISKGDSTLASFEKIDRPDLSPKRVVEFFPDQETGKIKHIGKGKTIEVDPENFEGRVFNLYDPNVQEEIAGKLGISDVAERLDQFDIEEGPIAFLERAILETQAEAQEILIAKTKAQKAKLESIKGRMSRQMSGMKRLQEQVTDLKDRLSKGDFSVKKTLEKKQAKLGQEKMAYKKAVKEWDEFKNVTVGKVESRNVAKEVDDFIQSFDIIQSGKKFYVQNDDILKGVGVDVLDHSKRSINKLSVSERAILRLVGAKPTDVLKNSPKQIQNLVSYVQGILGKGKMSRRNLMGIDEIAQENKIILGNAVTAQEEVINEMTNFFADSGVKLGVSTRTLNSKLRNISRSLKNEAGEAKVGMSDATKQVNDFIQDIERAYQATGSRDLNIADIVELRRAVQDKINFNRNKLNPNKNADAERVFNEFRVYLNDLVIDKASKFEATKPLGQAYKELNQQMSSAIMLDKMVMNALAREAVKKGISLSDMFTGTIGFSLGNLPTTMAVLTAKKGWDAYGNNILGVYGDIITKKAEAMNKAIKSSASGFIGSGRINVVRPATMGAYTLADYQKDKKKIEQGALTPDAMVNSFYEANAAAVDTLPKTSLAIQESVVRGNQFLLEKFPKGYDGLTSDFAPSQAALDKFDKYKRAIQDPKNALKEFEQGYMTPESIEVMKVVYPKIFRSLRAEVLDNIAGKKLTYSQRQQINRVFGIKTNLYQGAQANQMINQILEQQPQGDEMTQGEQSRAGKSKAPKEAQTATQRLMDEE